MSPKDMIVESGLITVVLEITAGAVAVALLAWRFIRPRSQIGDKLRAGEEDGAVQKGRKRSMSFASSALISGAFPERCKMYPTIIHSVLYVKNCPSTEAILDNCAQILMKYDRFRSAARVDKHGRWYFEDLGDPAEVVKDMVETIEVSSHSLLLAKVDEISSTDFATEHYASKPLWKLYRIVNTGSDGSSAILSRVHHVIGDGVSLIASMAKLFTNKNGEAYENEVTKRVGKGSRAKFDLAFLAKFFTSFFTIAGLGMSAYDSHLNISQKDKKKLHMESGRKTIAFPTIKLGFVKNVKNKAGVTVNDVLFSAISGAIRRYSLDRKQQKNLHARALLPVAFPRSAKELASYSLSMRNLWCLVSATMPMKSETAKDRLQECAQFTRELKASPMAFVQLWMQNQFLSRLPLFVARMMAFDIFSRHTMVFSNLPGPSQEVCFCGEPILGLHVVFPNILPQVLAISYAESVFVTFGIDPEATSADAIEKLPVYYLAELREMAKAYGVECGEGDIELLCNPLV